MTDGPMTDLLAQLRDARRSLVLRLAADLDADSGGPEPGFLGLLSDLENSITAVTRVMEEEA